MTYSGTATVQTLASDYDMLGAQDFMIQSNRYAKEEWMRANGIGVYGGKTEGEASTAYKPYYTDAQINAPAHNTDWFDEITRTGFRLNIIYLLQAVLNQPNIWFQETSSSRTV